MAAAFAALRCAALALALAAFSLAAVARADDAPPPQPAATPSGQKAGAGGRGDATNPPATAAEQHRLPPDSTTKQTLALPGRMLDFTATAGSIRLFNDKGEPQADIAYTAYQLDGADARNRPVTFVFNGGPGASSAWLQFGNVGPWRLPINAEAVTSSAAPDLMPNAETWLDFTDLVFIDPAATGYSHIVASGDNVRRQFFSVDGDADALAVVIRKWIEKNGRQASVKFLVGESYGGFRVPKVARALTGRQGVGVRGLIMISPVLDFANFGLRRHAPMSWVMRLPSMAATVFETKGGFDREALREVETYATGDYLRDLMRGERDAEAIERMAPRVAAYTGIDPTQVKRLAARVDTQTFQRELNRQRGMVASAYDPTITAFDPSPNSASGRFSDPVLDAIGPPITSAMTALYQGPLKWRVEQPYRLLNGEINGQWNWGRGRTGPEVVEDLRNALAGDRELHALVAHGASDLVTPYFGSQLIIDQLPVFGSADRLKLSVYGGGHMFYSRDASRRAFRDDAQALYRAVLQRE
jgi:carboxypeptidase C (cathepsin A)